MDNIKWDQLNWTTIGFFTQSILLVLALIDVDLVRFLIFRIGFLLILLGAGTFFLVKHGRRSRLWLAGQLLKNQDKILGGASKVFTLTPSKTAMLYFGFLSKLVAKPRLWELQPIIPKLPVPPLAQTCALYLQTIKPILSEAQYAQSAKVVQEFLAPGGVGEQLQAQLLAHASQPEVDNWLEEMWETFAYLRYREPLPLSSNWYGVDRPHPFPHDKISRAANTAAAILSFKQMIDSEELDPVLLYNAIPLCMEQYRRMFNTARVPMDPIDRIQHKPEARHLVVYYKGQLFNFSAYDARGVPLTRDQFAQHFTAIVDIVDNTPADQLPPSLGPLTAQDRSTWAKWRARLIADGNAEQLDIVESAILLFVLEDEKPDTATALAEQAAKGNPDNRWYDKSGTFIFWDNGRFSGNFEHTWGDAPVMVNLITYMFGVEDSKSSPGASSPASSSAPAPVSSSVATARLPPPAQIKFNLTEDVLAQIQQAKHEYEDKVVQNGVALYVLEFDQFGKNLVKNAKLSPDGFVQMALQLAYYTKHNKLCLTYESSHTRIFRKGRTETVRSASSDALAFVQSMHDPDAGDLQRINLLRKAVNSHIAYMRQAMSGNGVDRHLMGLYVIAYKAGLVGEKTPAIFTDAGYQLNYQLSTSQTPGYQTGGGGFNPTDLNGYGVSYVVNDDTLVFHVSSWKASQETSSTEFATSISEALMAMRAVLLTDSQMRRNLSHSKLVTMAQLEAD